MPNTLSSVIKRVLRNYEIPRLSVTATTHSIMNINTMFYPNIKIKNTKLNKANLVPIFIIQSTS